MNFTNQILGILWKDLLTEWRTKERLCPMVFFLFLTLLVFSFSFKSDGTPVEEIGPGVLWSSFVFAGLLGLIHTFAAEREDSCIDALLLSPGDYGAIYMGKMLGNLLFLLIVELLSLPIFALLFNLRVGLYLIPLLGVLFLGAASLASVGTLFAAMAENMRLREQLLPLLLLPIALPALISCVRATGLIFENSPPQEYLPYLQILGVYVVVFSVLSLILFEYILEE